MEMTSLFIKTLSVRIKGWEQGLGLCLKTLFDLFRCNEAFIPEQNVGKMQMRNGLRSKKHLDLLNALYNIFIHTEVVLFLLKLHKLSCFKSGCLGYKAALPSRG